MAYPIWIGAREDGKMIIEAANMKASGHIVDGEQVFGSQLPHRVVAKTQVGYRLMTPTDAKKFGNPISDWGEVPAHRQKVA